MLSEYFFSSKKNFSDLFKNSLLKNSNKIDKEYSNLINIENKNKDSKNKSYISKKRKRKKSLLKNNKKQKINKKIKNKCLKE